MAAGKEETKEKSKLPTAKKRILRSEKQRKVNKSFKSRVRGAIRQLEQVISSGDHDAAKTSLDQVYSLLDKGTKRNLYKANKTSRLKSRLAARVAKASA